MTSPHPEPGADAAQPYRSPLLDRAGAVAADPPDAGVAAHYGEPLREQRRLTETRAGFVDLSHRGVVRVGGPDRLGWLHSLTTQALEGLPPGSATTALVLSPHGHVEHVLYLVDDGEAVLAHTEPGAAAALVGFLDSMRFLLRVEVADVTGEYAVVWEPGAGADAPYPARSGADSLGGRELFVPRSELVGYADRAGPPAGVWALEALRIAAHQPRAGLETDHRTLPNEVGWLDTAVHLDKGCYRGQEAVARVHNLGRPPRRLAFLQLDGSADTLPGPGAEIHPGTAAPAVTPDRPGRPLGTLTSSARHADLGPIGLALLRRNVPVDAPLSVGGVPAAQETVVDPEVGLHVSRPAR